jgi:membrane associated rhomboid family serine protease
MNATPLPPENPAVLRIPARTRRQAMDWSLALTSQGIEPVIEQIEDGHWALVVAPADYDTAVSTIRQYRLENLHWPWRKPIFHNRFVFDWASVAWLLVVISIFWLTQTRSGLREAGIMDGAAVVSGEWWRLFTAIWLHGDLGHLVTNGAFGFLLLGLAMGRYGTGTGLLAAYLAGVGGNLASWLVHGDAHRSLGASGMVMGALGLVAVQSLDLLKRSPHAWRFATVGVVAGIMLFVLLGLSPGTDVVAHFGGFATGLTLGALLVAATVFARNALVNLAAGLLFAGLVISNWMLAMGVK